MMKEENEELEKIKALLFSGQEESIDLGLKLARSLGYYEKLIPPLEWLVSKELKKATAFLMINQLDLSGNRICSLPEQIGLYWIDSLESLPESIGQLKNLKKLNLRNNKLKKLPESIGQLTKLEKLSLADNNLESLPESIGQMRITVSLDLSGNNLESLPESIEGLTDLEELYLSGNPISKEALIKLKSQMKNCKIFMIKKQDDLS
jgi:Leucine-rich repeat (LRR) protein